MKQSNPKTYTAAANGSARSVKSTGPIFSTHGTLKPSCNASPADRGALDAAMAMPTKKNIGGSGMSAEQVRSVAMKSDRK